MHPDVPLVVPEVNGERAKNPKRGIIANPNCSTAQLVVALKPLHDVAKIKRVVVATYQSVSGTGMAAVDELEAQAHASLHGVEAPAPRIYPEPIAFNDCMIFHAPYWSFGSYLSGSMKTRTRTF